ncbi:hypothetical protein [Phreatobacter sp.]|uniref:hypothetical protein n=1 Tax=Phreatobacter sp. TaxID=1966341 RepID=UPI00261F2FEB|nr:hypothetical protein [Phreatobacter sp.]
MADVSSQAAAGAFRRRGFFVLGMHRSGTSVAAGVLSLLGITPPSTPMPSTPDNPKGYFESRKLQRFHDLVLADLGSRWDDWRSIDEARSHSPGADDIFARAVELLKSEFLHAHAFVLKDPRVCRIPGLWLEVFQACAVAPYVILPFRHPEEVAGSLARRDGMAMDKALLIWLRHVIDAERLSRGCLRAALDMDEVLADWRGAFARIGEQLSADWNQEMAAAGAAIDAFVDPVLRSVRRAPEAQPGLLLGLARDAYAAMVALRSDPQDVAAIIALDGIGSRLDSLAALIDAGPGAAPAVEPGLVAEAARIAGQIGARPAPAIVDPVARRLSLVAALNADRLAWLTETIDDMARAGAVQRAQIAELAGREPAALEAVGQAAQVQALKRERDALAERCAALESDLAAATADASRRQVEQETCEAALLDVLERHAALERRYEELERRIGEAEPRRGALIRRLTGE